MKIIECAQGSPEWKAARCGKVTASKIADLMDRLKNGNEGAKRRDYRTQIVAEILTGEPQDDVFVTREMQWGTDQEPFARAAYEIATGRIVDQMGLVLHPSIERAAASPDGLMMMDGGLIECKCPKTSTHLETLLSGEAPAKYLPQMQFQMACTGMLWCDFVSFDPRVPENLQVFIKRVHRNAEAIAAIEAEVQAFLGEVDEMLGQLRSFTVAA